MTEFICRHLTKTYKMGQVTVNALIDADFQVNAGEFVVILGPSGAGKSTLLNLLGGMDQATGGELLVKGNDLTQATERQLSEYRRNEVGFVFQFYNLMSNLTALENVRLASELVQHPLDAREVLEQVGLSGRMNNFPAQLSGGEQQRVAIARAIAKNPRFLLCDEPTGALDSATGKAVMKQLMEMSRKLEKTVVVVTHNSEIAKMADRVIRMHDGRIVADEYNSAPELVEDLSW